MPQQTPPSKALTRTRYGTSHPERVENELWKKVIQENWNGYQLGQHLQIKGAAGRFCQDFSHSSYRDSDPGPFWSWERFGRTSTSLSDGRVIHIAGEHEDSYDPDFCIYNDVVVEHPDGRREIYLYPKDVFAPTDFHSATLIGDEILLIGSLGYHDLRRPGETQVLKLDTRTMRFEPIATTGEGPGWISRHSAERLGEMAILVIGGNVQTAAGHEPNTGLFVLDLTTMTWQRREHGDMALFPVSDEIFRNHKNPRYGTANPERIDNPFWLEMARRQWPPSRARLHFGDFAPPEPGLEFPEYDLSGGDDDALMASLTAEIEIKKLARTIDDVVWTAVREDALKVALPDGRNLLIGGEVRDYGDEYGDPWVYNDIVITHPDGTIDILAYPKEVFPHFSGMAGALHNEDVYLLGIPDRERHPDRSRGLVVLRFDTFSYMITELPVAAPPARVYVYGDSSLRINDRYIVFPIVQQRGLDPELGIALDLETLKWSKPFPHPHRNGG
jgi:hypothetical protein